MPRLRIRTVTFDWGDTLATNYGMPYLETQRRAFGALAGTLRALGFTVREDFAAQAMRELAVAWQASIDQARNPEHREFDFAAMLHGWVAATGADPGAAAVQAAVATCGDALADTVHPFAESAPALAALRKLGYRIGVLSHVPWPGPACRRWFVRHGLAEHIDFYSLSSEVGWIKPHPAHYTDAVRQAGCAPEEVLHVGDHPERDVRGGKAFGFRTVLRHTENIYPEAVLRSCGADAEILRLPEIFAVLDRLHAGDSQPAVR